MSTLYGFPIEYNNTLQAVTIKDCKKLLNKLPRGTTYYASVHLNIDVDTEIEVSKAAIKRLLNKFENEMKASLLYWIDDNAARLDTSF